MTKNARIVGKVEYREGDGANITIRPGPCEVEVTALDATISWSDGDFRGSAAIPIGDYRRYLSRKALQIIDAQASCAGRPQHVGGRQDITVEFDRRDIDVPGAR